MVTCPWCGTHYTSFQPNCSNCGGPLDATPGLTPAGEIADDEERLPVPPPPPRSISAGYLWRLLLADGWALAAIIPGLIGAIFSFVGIILTVGIVTAFIGLPFALLGLLMLGGGLAVFIWRYREMQKVVGVLRLGEAARGQVVDLQENVSVQINGRNPWQIRYEYQVNGQTYTGEVSSLATPGPALQPGRGVCVLYLPGSPELNSLYPRP